jgi:hypothetical protein
VSYIYRERDPSRVDSTVSAGGKASSAGRYPIRIYLIPLPGETFLSLLPPSEPDSFNREKL